MQVRWANVQAIDVKFSRNLTYQKSLKSLNFWQSYLINKKVDVFFGTQCVFTGYLPGAAAPGIDVTSSSTSSWLTFLAAYRTCTLFVGISKLGLTDLISVDSREWRSTAAITATCCCRSSCCPWCVTCQTISSSFNKTANLHTGHVTPYFLSSQHPLSFLQICGRRTAPTL